jgi:hypothetical protein
VTRCGTNSTSGTEDISLPELHPEDGSDIFFRNIGNHNRQYEVINQ